MSEEITALKQIIHQYQRWGNDAPHKSEVFSAIAAAIESLDKRLEALEKSKGTQMLKPVYVGPARTGDLVQESLKPKLP